MIDALDEQLHALLLGRSLRQPLTADDRRAFHDQTVLVTGAGGSIGSVLSLEIAACRPRRLVLFEQSEYHLFWLERLVRETSPHVAVESVLGDVTRSEDVDAAVRAARKSPPHEGVARRRDSTRSDHSSPSALPPVSARRLFMQDGARGSFSSRRSLAVQQSI